MVNRINPSFLRNLLVAVLFSVAWWSAQAADETIDLQKTRELHVRVQHGESLSPTDQAYYDRGKLEWERQRSRIRPSSRRDAAAAGRIESDPTEEVKVVAGQGFSISEKTCPIEMVTATTTAGVEVVAMLRKPPGPGPFPALIQLHGGLRSESNDRLRSLVSQPTMSRFLDAGYLIVAPTFRDRDKDPQTRDALDDCLTMIDWVKRRSDVDPNSVVVWGDSGGGSLALELAGETSLAAVAAQEPATILMIGIMTKENYNTGPLMRDARKYWTPELQMMIREKIRKIECPVFIAYGDKSQINNVNHEMVIPELKAAGKQVETKLYPGQHHGFSKLSGEFFEDASRFFGQHLAMQPTPLSLRDSPADSAPSSNEVK